MGNNMYPSLLDSILFSNFSSTEKQYPPHNIVKFDEENYLIELAVAGFSKHDMTVDVEKNILTITGTKEKDVTRTYQHHGISDKNFNRKFVLANDVEVGGVTYMNGILGIELKRIIPKELKKREIQIW